MKSPVKLTLSLALLYTTFFAVAYGLASFKESCGQNLPCDAEKFLACSKSGQCECLRSNSMTFEETSGKCVALAGEKCAEGIRTRKQAFPCVAHAECDRYFSGNCECYTNYHKAKNGACIPTRKNGEACQVSEECQSVAGVCINGTCVCDTGHLEEPLAEGEPERCKKKVGVSCGREGSDCVVGARCSGGRCECDYGFFKTTAQSCEKKRNWNQPCENNGHCDYKKHLVCGKEKTCQCKELYVVHPETKICKMKPDSSMLLSNRLSYMDLCLPNADYKVDPYNGRQSDCFCKENSKFHQKLNDYCYIIEGETCDGDRHSEITTKMCLPGLVCRNQKCTCPFKGHQAYHETLEKCLSYVAGPCTNTTDCHDANAECTRSGPQQSLRCHCKTGYLEAGRRCEAPYGARCNQRNDSARCDSRVPLECSSKGVCECPELQTYDEVKETCRGLEGANCNLGRGNTTNFCVDGATCESIHDPDGIAGICVCNKDMLLLENRTCVSQAPKE